VYKEGVRSSLTAVRALHPRIAGTGRDRLLDEQSTKEMDMFLKHGFGHAALIGALAETPYSLHVERIMALTTAAPRPL
jgi:hypothetical protein